MPLLKTMRVPTLQVNLPQQRGWWPQEWFRCRRRTRSGPLSMPRWPGLPQTHAVSWVAPSVVPGADRRTLTSTTHQGEEWFKMNQNPAADVVPAGKHGTAVPEAGAGGPG